MGYGIFTKLLGGTVIMLVAGYMGEEIFAGEACKPASKTVRVLAMKKMKEAIN